MEKGLNRLAGKVALVTGSARQRGMGFAVARKFGAEGAALALADLKDEVLQRAEELRAEGYQAAAYKVDLTKAIDVSAVVRQIRERLGTIDLVCNVAGMSMHPRPPFLEMTEEYFDHVMAINLKSTFNVCKAVVPGMVEQSYGRIVNWSSISGNLTAYRYSAAYCASKGAITGLTLALALELGEHNITVNSILPGEIDTHGERPWIPADGHHDLGVFADHLRAPIRRPGSPEDVADLALFLCGDDSKYITGTQIIIDGGITIVEPGAKTITYKR